jgi:hypothetical protein
MIHLWRVEIRGGTDSHLFNLIAGVILWELVAFKKPYDGMNREEFYLRVVRGGERPAISKKWPEDLTELMKSCWE